MKLFKKLSTSLLISSLLLSYAAPVLAQEEGESTTPPVTDPAPSTDNTGGETTNPAPESSVEEIPETSETPGGEDSGTGGSSESSTGSSENSRPESGSESSSESQPEAPAPTTIPSRPVTPPAGNPQAPNWRGEQGTTSPGSSNNQDYVAPAPSTQPDYYINEDQTDEEVESEEEKSLLDGPYVAFTANVFLSEEEADEFIKMIEEDEEAGDRFVTKKVLNENGSVIVLVNYAEDASEEGRAILFYVETKFETEEEAEEYAEFYLNIYPDIFFDAEVINMEDEYNVIFGTRSTADVLKLSYNLDTLDIDYKARREPFTYTVEADALGVFVDPIPEAVEAAFPGEFTFEVEEISETEREVTMIPVEPQKIDADLEESQEAESESESNE